LEILKDNKFSKGGHEPPFLERDTMPHPIGPKELDDFLVLVVVEKDDLLKALRKLKSEEEENGFTVIKDDSEVVCYFHPDSVTLLGLPSGVSVDIPAQLYRRQRVFSDNRYNIDKLFPKSLLEEVAQQQRKKVVFKLFRVNSVRGFRTLAEVGGIELLAAWR